MCFKSILPQNSKSSKRHLINVSISVCFICDPFKKLTIRPSVFMFTLISTLVHPEPSSQFPIAFMKAISICRGPDKHIFENKLGCNHCACFESASIGWFAITTGIWDAFKWFTISFLTVTQWNTNDWVFF